MEGDEHMAKTSTAVKNRYNAKAYDQLPIRIPKGQKATVQAHAESKGLSTNGLVNELLKTDMGLEAWPEVKEP